MRDEVAYLYLLVRSCFGQCCEGMMSSKCGHYSMIIFEDERKPKIPGRFSVLRGFSRICNAAESIRRVRRAKAKGAPTLAAQCLKGCDVPLVCPGPSLELAPAAVRKPSFVGF